MVDSIDKLHFRTIIIGGGQAGLSTAYHLSQMKEDYVILDTNERVGDVWRKRWDSLRLFTPSQHDGLDGFPFPSPRNSFPTKDQMADYLENYARKFSLQSIQGVYVSRLSRPSQGFELATDKGVFTSDRIVVATGPNQHPRIPEFARNLDPGILQMHSSVYVNPMRVPGGAALIVGAATSGVEIAVELAANRETYIAGRPTFHVPDFLLRYAGEAYWLFVNNILTIATPIGRKVKPKFLKSGSPLIRISAKDLERAKVKQVPRVSGVKDGKPQLQDGRVLSVTTVVWSTGFSPAFSWIDMDILDASGWPASKKGISTTIRGLYFVGMPFQFGLTSGLVGGVSRDAAFVAAHIHETR